jgi:hypothetical protein
MERPSKLGGKGIAFRITGPFRSFAKVCRKDCDGKSWFALRAILRIGHYVATMLLRKVRLFFPIGILAAMTACNSNPLGTSGTMLVFPGPTNVDWAGSYDFGNLGIGLQSPSATFTIENDGYASISFSGTSPVSVSGTNAADFTISSQPAASEVTSGSSTTFAVQFNPSGVTKESAQVSVVSSTGTFTFAVSGTGANSGTLGMTYNGSTALTQGATVTFPGVTSASPYQTVTFEIANSNSTEPLSLLGSAPVVVTNTTGAYSIVTKPVSPVQPQGGHTELVIQESFLGPGTYTETVTVKTSDSSGPLTFTITGTQS